MQREHTNEKKDTHLVLGFMFNVRIIYATVKKYKIVLMRTIYC